MSKYIIIANGELVTDSKALDRATEYAEMAIADQGKAHIYTFVKTVLRSAITESTKVPCDVLSKPEKTNGAKKSRVGISCKRWTPGEEDILRSLIKNNPNKTDVELARHVVSECLMPSRTKMALAYRIGQLRRGMK